MTFSGVLEKKVGKYPMTWMFTDRASSPGTHITCTIAPQPEYASLSTAFSSVWEIVSNKSSGSRSGSHSPSATPYSFELAVPATTKSFAKLRQPIKSDAAMKGLYSPEGFLVSPAITGSMKYGPNRLS